MSLSLDCDDELVNRLTDFFEREKMEQIFQSVYAENAALFAEVHKELKASDEQDQARWGVV